MIVNRHFFEMGFYNCRWHSNAQGGDLENDVKRCGLNVILKISLRVTQGNCLYSVIKKMTGQGVFYVQLEAGLEFYYKPDSEGER